MKKQKPNLFFTLVIGLAVLLFGIVIKSALYKTAFGIIEGSLTFNDTVGN